MAQIGGSSGSQSSKMCEQCSRMTLHESNVSQAGCILTVLTCGLGLPIWILMALFQANWICQTCGMRRR